MYFDSNSMTAISDIMKRELLKKKEPEKDIYAPLEEQARFAFDEDLVRKFFSESEKGLSMRQGMAEAGVARQASALGSARGLLNLPSFISNQTTRASEPYAQAFQELATNKAGALQGSQVNLWKALMSLQEMRDTEKWRKLNYDLEKKRLEQEDAGFFDYLGALLPIAGKFIKQR